MATTSLFSGGKERLSMKKSSSVVHDIPQEDACSDDNVTGDSKVQGGVVPAVEYVPPKSLVWIWSIMAAELGFDLVTTIIAFVATIGDQYCCGYTIHLGPLPLTSTVPFFLLILAELSFLGRAILLTLWPSVFGGESSSTTDGDESEKGFEVTLTNTVQEEQGNVEKMTRDASSSSSLEESSSSDHSAHVDMTGTVKSVSSRDSKPIEDSERDEVEKDDAIESSQQEEGGVSKYKTEQPQSTEDAKTTRRGSTTDDGHKKTHWLRRGLCCCFQWNSKILLNALNLLTLLNPFFGCLIAWMLLYQSDKTESFVVLGLEGFSIILHFTAVRLEGGLRTWCSKLLHSITIIPFLVSVILVLVYLREGGVCYVVESQLFLFSGCEVCPDTLEPPDVNGMCGNETIAGTGGVVQDFENFDITNLGALAKRGAYQDSYCSSDQEVNFCFYPF